MPEGTKAEIINGQLEVAAAKPTVRHRFVTYEAVRSLGSRFGGGGNDSEWFFEIEPDVQFGQHILSPDIAGWRRAKRGKINPDESLVKIIPDWVCEILSPSSGRRDRLEKFKIYQEHGVSYYWIIDPVHKTIDAFVNDTSANTWKRLGVWGEKDKARIEPFQDLEIDLSTFWVLE